MNALDIIVGHALNTLPDHIAPRKKILQAVLDSTRDNHPTRRAVSKMLSTLEEHERAQSSLPLDFSHDGETPNKGNI